MKSLPTLASILIALQLSSCSPSNEGNTPKAPAASVTSLPHDTSSSEVAPLTDLVDQPLFNKAEMVIRGHQTTAYGGSKYHWCEVKITSILKSPDQIPAPTINQNIKVASICFGHGVPRGEATFYLVLYNPSHPEYGWKLLELPDDSSDPTKIQPFNKSYYKKGYSHNH